MFHPSNSDILIAGAGIAGLALALQLESRGAHVTVLERDCAMQHASSAAAGMLAVNDPHNPPQLLPLSQLSVSLYPAFLRRIEALSGTPMPFQTDTTIQHLADGSTLQIAENSIDPGQFAALIAAVRASTIKLHEHTALERTAAIEGRREVFATSGERFTASQVVYTTGAWPLPHWPTGLDECIRPVKGQIMRMQLPAGFTLRVVHRSDKAYVMPRTHGPQAGSVIVGATVEDAGFDTETDEPSLAVLRTRAAQLVPQLADATHAPILEAWAGLRPSTTDQLPVLGRIAELPEFLANGLYRNGILLAPATASVLADLLEGKTPPVDLQPFSPQRFIRTT